jgi:hypothetical protein
MEYDVTPHAKTALISVLSDFLEYDYQSLAGDVLSYATGFLATIEQKRAPVERES